MATKVASIFSLPTCLSVCLSNVPNTSSIRLDELVSQSSKPTEATTRLIDAHLDQWLELLLDLVPERIIVSHLADVCNLEDLRLDSVSILGKVLQLLNVFAVHNAQGSDLRAWPRDGFVVEHDKLHVEQVWHSHGVCIIELIDG